MRSIICTDVPGGALIRAVPVFAVSPWGRLLADLRGFGVGDEFSWKGERRGRVLSGGLG